jgi:hypothetical protein
MSNDFDFKNSDLFGPVAFRPGFNAGEAITANQAWSLFFSASREDKLLLNSPEVAAFMTWAVVAIAATGIFGALAFKPF